MNTPKDKGPRAPSEGDRPNAAEPMAPGDEAPAGTRGTGETVCPACGGSGRLRGGTCPQCAGRGKIVQGIGGG
jgi:hypothetical protein